MVEVRFPLYRTYTAARQDADNAMMALVAGSRLAEHALQLTADSHRLLPEMSAGLRLGACRLDEARLAALDGLLEAGPRTAGWQDQRWTLARIRDLVIRKFGVASTVPGIWYLLRRRG